MTGIDISGVQPDDVSGNWTKADYARAAARYRATEKGKAAAEATARLRRTPEGRLSCGTDYRLLFHHLDPATKRCKVTAMASYSDAEFSAEVAKCVVVCPGCHKARHREMEQICQPV